MSHYFRFFDTPEEKKNDNQSLDSKINTLDNLKSDVKKVFIFFIYILIAAVIGWIIKLISINIRRNSDFNNTNLNKAVESMYVYLLKVMAYVGVERKPGSTNIEYHNELEKLSYIEKEDLDNIYKCIMQVGYSQINVENEDYINMKKSIKKLLRDHIKSLEYLKN